MVLAERDKEEMEMEIAKLEFDFLGTLVICRSGSPLILADLKKVWWNDDFLRNFLLGFISFSFILCFLSSLT